MSALAANNDVCYAGLSAAGKVILKPSFAASILRAYAPQDHGRVQVGAPGGISRAFDAAPETHNRIIDLMNGFLESLAGYYESDELDADTHDRLIQRLRQALSTLENTEKSRRSVTMLERSTETQHEKEQEKSRGFMANDKATPLGDRIAGIRARRTARGFDSHVPAAPDYATLQAQYDAARSERAAVPAITGIEGASYMIVSDEASPAATPTKPAPSAIDQVLERERLRYQRSAESQSNQTLDTYVGLQQYYDSRRRG